MNISPNWQPAAAHGVWWLLAVLANGRWWRVGDLLRATRAVQSEAISREHNWPHWLYWLVEKGWVRRAQRPDLGGAEMRANPWLIPTLYQITAEGRRRLAIQVEQWRRLGELADGGERHRLELEAADVPYDDGERRVA